MVLRKRESRKPPHYRALDSYSLVLFLFYMKITYIFHSGFAVEMQHCILIFDYWMDPSHSLEKLLASTDKRIYVFSSHFHEDHFNKRIFDWKNIASDSSIRSGICCRERFIQYILSKDILKRGRAKKEEADVWLAKGGTWRDDYISVIATGSTDSGVSWIVETEGIRFFHSGDLCNWYARFLSEPNPSQTIISDEFGEINPVAEEKQYLGELKDVKRLLNEHTVLRRTDGDPDFDVVFFPVDGRIGNGYTLGGRQFIERFSVGLFVPMHFVASGFESAWRMEPFCSEKNIPFWSIRQEGELLEVIKDMIIRKTALSDIPQLQRIFAAARMFMAQTGNPNQWAESYPSEELLQRDIESGDSYVCIANRQIVATFVLRGGEDPTYNVIYNGAWLNDKPYATIHRIASDGTQKGIFGQVLAFAHQRYDTVRIDTHRDNHVMQHLLQKHGFAYCGIIHCWNGDERLAFQTSEQA